MLDEVDFFAANSSNWEDRLKVIVDLMRELSKTSDPEEMYQIFSRRMKELLYISRSISISRRHLDYPNVRVTRCSLWKHRVTPWENNSILPVVSGGILAELIYGNNPVVLDDLKIDRHDPGYYYLEGQRSLLAIPNYDDGEALNMVIITREESEGFVKSHIPELVWLSNLFGRATQATLLSKKLKKAFEIADHEMQIVGQLQKSILPSKLPEIPGLDLAVYYHPSMQSGGDYYDVFVLPKGRYGILIADVAGHGTSAAVLMAITHSTVRTYTGSHYPPGLLLSYLNKHLAMNYTKHLGQFVTAFYAIYDPERSLLTYANAGHSPPRFLRSSDNVRFALEGKIGLPLGISERAEYHEESLQLVNGDQIIFFTDGIIEIVNSEGEPFGIKHLEEAISGYPVGAKEILEAILEKIGNFSQGQTATDDQTILAAKFFKPMQLPISSNRESAEYSVCGS